MSQAAPSNKRVNNYSILANKSLKEISVGVPTTIAELKQIHGIGMHAARCRSDLQWCTSLRGGGGGGGGALIQVTTRRPNTASAFLTRCAVSCATRGSACVGRFPRSRSPPHQPAAPPQTLAAALAVEAATIVAAAASVRGNLPLLRLPTSAPVMATAGHAVRRRLRGHRALSTTGASTAAVPHVQVALVTLAAVVSLSYALVGRQTSQAVWTWSTRNPHAAGRLPSVPWTVMTTTTSTSM